MEQKQHVWAVSEPEVAQIRPTCLLHLEEVGVYTQMLQTGIQSDVRKHN